MKYIKTFEGIFSSFFGNKKTTDIGSVKWSYMETVKLEDIECYRKMSSINVPFYFEPDFSDKIKYIKIEKHINYTSDSHFYRVEINFIFLKNKQIIKDFEIFNDMIEFVKSHTEIETTAKKYNL